MSSGVDITATLDEIIRDADGVELARLVTDTGDELVIPVQLLPAGSSVNDVIRLHLERDPDEASARLSAIEELQRKLFGKTW